MSENNKKLEKVINYWHDSALDDLKAAESLFEKKFYPQSLFFCHLSVEKLLKALVMRQIKKLAPFSHDLRRLANLAGLNTSQERKALLDDISRFNIAGRYSEEKFAFHQKYNKKEIAEKYLTLTKALISWLKKEFQRK